jgi:hypothetical protein
VEGVGLRRVRTDRDPPASARPPATAPTAAYSPIRGSRSFRPAARRRRRGVEVEQCRPCGAARCGLPRPRPRDRRGPRRPTPRGPCRRRRRSESTRPAISATPCPSRAATPRCEPRRHAGYAEPRGPPRTGR